MIPNGHLATWFNNPKEIVLNLVGFGFMEFPQELLEHIDQIYKMDISENQIQELPSFPKIQSLICRRNLLTSLPLMPNVVYIDASHNLIQSTNPYPCLREMYINNNLIHRIERIPNCNILFAVNNQLNSLPTMYDIKSLIILGNPIDDIIDDWKKIWIIRDQIDHERLLRYARRWIARYKALLKKQIHDDMFTSPNLPGGRAFFTQLWSPITQNMNRLQKLSRQLDLDIKTDPTF